MNVTRHLCDTRTGEGRVRFLLYGGRVRLVAEGPGWFHDSLHPTLEDAALGLALLPRVSHALYGQALGDLERQLQWNGVA